MLSSIASELERRAKSDRTGGWSTNHVEPMERLAENIYSHLGQGGDEKDTYMLYNVAERIDWLERELRIGGWSTQNQTFFKSTCTQIFAFLGRSRSA